MRGNERTRDCGSSGATGPWPIPSRELEFPRGQQRLGADLPLREAGGLLPAARPRRVAVDHVRARHRSAARAVPGDHRARDRRQSQPPRRGGERGGGSPVSGSVGARHIPIDADGTAARTDRLLGLYAHEAALGIRPVRCADRHHPAYDGGRHGDSGAKQLGSRVHARCDRRGGAVSQYPQRHEGRGLHLPRARRGRRRRRLLAHRRGGVPALAPAEGLLGPRRRASAALAVGDPDLLAALAPHELEEVADRAARLQAYVMARAGDKKEERFNGMLLVHTTQPEAAQRVIEELLQVQARRWRLAEIVPAEQGRSSLEYLIRLRDEFLPATLLDALKGRGTPPIDAAEYRSLRGLKKRKEE